MTVISIRLRLNHRFNICYLLVYKLLVCECLHCSIGSFGRIVALYHDARHLALAQLVKLALVALLHRLNGSALLRAIKCIAFVFEEALVALMIWGSAAKNTNTAQYYAYNQHQTSQQHESRFQIVGIGTIIYKTIYYEQCNSDNNQRKGQRPTITPPDKAYIALSISLLFISFLYI